MRSELPSSARQRGDPGRRPAWLRRMGDSFPWRTLRLQLTAWSTLVVLLTVIVTLVGVREGLRLTLQHENDTALVDDAREVGLAVQQFFPHWDQVREEMERKSLGHADRKLALQLLDNDGQTLAASGEPSFMAEIPLPRGDRTTPWDVGECRIYQRRLIAEHHPELTLRVAGTLELIEEDLAKLTRLMAIAGIVILFVAPVGGYFLARRSTRPIAQIIYSASRLRPRHREERLPMRGSGDELDQLSGTINRFLDRIADYLNRNREFVANAAHELRSPLAARSTRKVPTAQGRCSPSACRWIMGGV